MLFNSKLSIDVVGSRGFQYGRRKKPVGWRDLVGRYQYEFLFKEIGALSSERAVSDSCGAVRT